MNAPHSVHARIGAQAAGPDIIAVVIPSYKVTRHILGVIEAIGPEVARIYVVDDQCPDGSGAFVRAHCRDPRVTVLEHDMNQGVGGAVLTGYRGEDDRQLWSRPMRARGSSWGVEAYALPAVSQKCADVVAIGYGERGDTVQLLSSAGQPWWTVDYGDKDERGRLSTYRTPKRLC